MKDYLFLILFLIVSLSTCSFPEKDVLFEYSLEDISAINLNEEYPLDSLVDEMTVIPLETKDYCLINDVTFLKESKDYYFVYTEKTSRLFQFDKSGRYVATISRKGQGPEEYLSVKKIMLDEDNQELYLMDYMGRKMKVFGFDGSFLRAFPLPEDFAYTNCFLSLANEAIYYVSSNNSIQMDFLKYDLKTSKFVSYSHREREMDKGEFFMGQTLFGESDSFPFVYHYFNDTVFQVRPEGLVPHHLLKLGERCLSWNDFKADAFANPRPQVHKIQIWGIEMIKDKVCIFYTLSRFEGKPSPMPLMAVYTLGQKGIVSHVNWTSNRFLSIEHGAIFTLGFQRNTLLRSVLPENLDNEFRKKHGIDEEDNPVILKYSLK